MSEFDVSACAKILAQRLKELEADLAYLSLRFQLVPWAQKDEEELEEIVKEIETRHEELDWLCGKLTAASF